MSENYFKNLLYRKKGKFSNFDKINSLEDSEFDFDFPSNNFEENQTQEINFKNFIINCM